MDTYIDIRQVSFSYEDHSDGQLEDQALDNVTFAVGKGEHVAVLGRNGSGKSTLARLINGLEIPGAGSITVAGYSTEDEEESWEVRRRCGMVFQNPDNQIVATTVEEDVAFGPENLGIPSPLIREAVDRALEYVGLTDYARKAPTELSGGQKQKLAIAGILAMQPECLILDEATSMLDPEGRTAFIDLVLRLQKEHGLTVINITHDMAEARHADRVIVLHEGRVLLMGTPAEIFHYVDEIRDIGLDVPVHTAVARRLTQMHGIEIPVGSASTPAQAESAVRANFTIRGESMNRIAAEQTTAANTQEQAPAGHTAGGPRSGDAVVEVRDLSYSYQSERPLPEEAIHNISFDVRRGEFFGIMGHSGSGKSTLIQHLNGLLRVQRGDVRVLGRDLRKVKDIRDLRRHVQILFQYPEHQLFADTVREDIAFGPGKLGVPADEIEERISDACLRAGVEEAWLERSPFELSGGEKRRVALAGILAMRPDILILDEPAAGLDPAGREEVLAHFKRLNAQGITVIMVSHSMEDLARLCDRILVLNQGRRVMLDTPAGIFSSPEKVKLHHLAFPAGKAFLERFRKDLPALDTNCFTIDEAVEILDRVLEPRIASEESGRP